MSQELQNVELCNNNGDPRDYFGFCPDYEIYIHGSALYMGSGYNWYLSVQLAPFP